MSDGAQPPFRPQGPNQQPGPQGQNYGQPPHPQQGGYPQQGQQWSGQTQGGQNYGGQNYGGQNHGGQSQPPQWSTQQPPYGQGNPGYRPPNYGGGGGQYSPPPPKKSQKGWLIGGIIASVLVVALVCATLFALRNRPGKDEVSPTPTAAPTTTEPSSDTSTSPEPSSADGEQGALASVLGDKYMCINDITSPPVYTCMAKASYVSFRWQQDTAGPDGKVLAFEMYAYYASQTKNVVASLVKANIVTESERVKMNKLIDAKKGEINSDWGSVRTSVTDSKYYYLAGVTKDAAQPEYYSAESLPKTGAEMVKIARDAGMTCSEPKDKRNGSTRCKNGSKYGSLKTWNGKSNEVSIDFASDEEKERALQVFGKIFDSEPDVVAAVKEGASSDGPILRSAEGRNVVCFQKPSPYCSVWSPGWGLTR